MDPDSADTAFCTERGAEGRREAGGRRRSEHRSRQPQEKFAKLDGLKQLEEVNDRASCKAVVGSAARL